MNSHKRSGEASVLSGFLYGFTVIFKPFSGFWDMKHEKRGNFVATLIFLFLLFVSSIVMEQYSGFIFNQNNTKMLNVIDIISSAIGPVLLWSVSAWCVTTLMDGEGSFKDIMMATGYATVPLVLTKLLYTVLTNVLILDEGSITGVILSIGMVWMCFLMFSSTLSIHQFTLTQTVLAIALTILAAGVIIFIGLLFINLIEQMYNYGYSIVKEILLRL